MADRETRFVRWLCVALFAMGTAAWALGREGHGLPTADLHADAPYYYVYLPSLMHGDLDFSDEYRETKNWYHLGSTPTRKPANVFGIGPAIASAPLFTVGHVLALVTGSRSDGFSTWEIRLYTWSSLAWSLGAVIIVAQLVRRRLRAGPALAIAGPLAAALSSPIIFYAVREPGYAHPLATFVAALLVERWDASYEAPRTLRTWIVLGALLGAAALARPQLALWAVLLAAAAVDDLRKRREVRVALPWLAGAATAFIVFAPQLIAWKVLYGSWYVVPQGAGFMRWDAPCWSEVLFSSRNGLFPWSPAYAVFAIALVALVRRMPRLVGLLVLGVALQTWANGAVWDWWGGGSFGGRRFDSTFVAFAFGAGAIAVWLARVLPAAFARVARARARVIGALALVLAFVLADLAWVNLELAASQSATSVRITGGVPAANLWRRHAGGIVAAWMSSFANAPARLAFAWRYGVGFDEYDHLVGVYALGETFPGLNSYGDERTAMLVAPPLDADGHTRLLIGLNREGSLDVTVPVGDAATITWNGERVASHFETDELRRGINELAIDAPAGTVIGAIKLEAK